MSDIEQASTSADESRDSQVPAAPSSGSSVQQQRKKVARGEKVRTVRERRPRSTERPPDNSERSTDAATSPSEGSRRRRKVRRHSTSVVVREQLLKLETQTREQRDTIELLRERLEAARREVSLLSAQSPRARPDNSQPTSEHVIDEILSSEREFVAHVEMLCVTMVAFHARSTAAAPSCVRLGIVCLRSRWRH